MAFECPKVFKEGEIANGEQYQPEEMYESDVESDEEFFEEESLDNYEIAQTPIS